MTFSEAAMIMMSGGANPSASKCSLDGIKSLKTLGTITFGSIVCEVKEPYQFTSGYVSVNSSDNAVYQAYKTSVVVNDTVAAYSYYDYAFTDVTTYRNDGSIYTERLTGFKLTDISYSGSANHIFDIVPFYTCFYTIYDSAYESTSSFSKSGSSSVYFQYDRDIFTNLGIKEYAAFAATCSNEMKHNTPVINIFE